MDRRQLLAAGLATAATVVAPATLHAQEARLRDVVGSWFGSATAVEPPLGTANNLITFHLGGVATESRRYLVPGTPFGNLLETSGHGAWRRDGGGRFKAFVRFFIQDAASGAPIGTDNVSLSLAVDEATGRLLGTFKSQIKDHSDGLIFEVSGDYAATQIVV
jgi:hypothetical protein